jgi:hypothetical protein
MWIDPDAGTDIIEGEYPVLGAPKNPTLGVVKLFSAGGILRP